MADFRYLIGKVVKYEGGLSSDPVDGAANWHRDNIQSRFPKWKEHTNKGVTTQTWVGMSKDVGYKPYDYALFEKMPHNIWLRIYEEGYWKPVGGHKIKSQAIANQVFEHSWGAGLKNAQKLLRKALRRYGYNDVDPTGSINTDFITTRVNAADEQRLYKILSDVRWQYYQDLLARKPSYERFRKGWERRVREVTQDGWTLIAKTFTPLAQKKKLSTKNWASAARGSVLGSFLRAVSAFICIKSSVTSRTLRKSPPMGKAY